MDRLNLLALIVALSAYVAGIRFATIGRLAALKSTDTAKRKDLHTFLRQLVIADAPLVVAGLLVAFDLFPNPLFGKPTPPAFLLWGQRIFVVAIVVLAVLHAQAWYGAIVPSGKTPTPESIDAEISRLDKEAKAFIAEKDRDAAALEALQANLRLAAAKSAAPAQTDAGPKP